MIGLYFFIVSLDSISFTFLGSVLAPLLAQHTGFFSGAVSSLWSHVMYGIVIALFPLVYALSSPMLGALSDRWGRKSVTLGCLVMTLLGFVSYALAFYSGSLGVLLLGRVLAGIGCANECIVQAAVMDAVEPKAKPKVVSFIAIAMTMGLFLGPLIATVWAHYAAVYIFSVMLGLIVLAIVLLVRTRVSSAVTSLTHTPAWRFLWQAAEVRRALWVFVFFELGWSLYFQAIPLVLSVRWQQGHEIVGYLGSGIGGALILCLFIINRIHVRFCLVERWIRCALWLGVAAFLANILLPSLGLFCVYACPIVLAVAILYPFLIVRLSDLSKEHHGFIIGVAGALLSFAFALNGFLASLMTYIDDRLPFLVAGLCWIIALFFIKPCKAGHVGYKS